MTGPQQQVPVEKFGHYNLMRKIGQGGMAEVWLATVDNAPPGSPPVVVKRLHQELERNPDAVDLFLTEADVTLMLQHPNVIKVYDSGEFNNRSIRRSRLSSLASRTNDFASSAVGSRPSRSR